MKPHETVDPQTEQLIRQVSGNPLAMLMVASTLLLPKGNIARARELGDAALELAPGDGQVRALAHTIQSSGVGAWYFTMVQDEGRHARYTDAFRKILSPGCTVLDIGAGTGLFAMLAAREGAAKVLACERKAVIADTAREIIERNGYSDLVTVIAKDSRELDIGADLDSPVDVLLWDNLANNLLGAGGLEAIDDARGRLLKPGGAVIPGRCEVRVALAEAKPIADTQMGNVDGFDMSPFNRFRPSPLTLKQNRFEVRSNSASIFDFDFRGEGSVPASPAETSVKGSGGRVDGIAQWLRFHLADGVVYDTREDEGVTAFGVQYHPVDPFDAKQGKEIAIAGGHDRIRTWFWIKGR